MEYCGSKVRAATRGGHSGTAWYQRSQTQPRGRGARYPRGGGAGARSGDVLRLSAETRVRRGDDSPHIARDGGQRTIDDKDYYGNKRLELAGQLLALLFEDCFKRLNADLKRQADAVLSKSNRATQFDILKCIRQDTLSNGLEHAISSGNWTVKRFRMERKGVTQVLSRLSFISALGMMTRITSQFENAQGVRPARAAAESVGHAVPSDTPEGESCGLVKNLALMTHVTTDDEEDAPAIARARATTWSRCCTSPDAEMHAPGSALVLLNGSILGAHRHPARFARAGGGALRRHGARRRVRLWCTQRTGACTSRRTAGACAGRCSSWRTGRCW